MPSRIRRTITASGTQRANVLQNSTVLRLLQRFPDLNVGWIATVASGWHRAALKSRLDWFAKGLTGCTPPVCDTVMAWRSGGRRAARPPIHRTSAPDRFEDFPFMSKPALLGGLLPFLSPDIDTIWEKSSSGTSGRTVTVPYGTVFYLEYAYLSSVKAALAGSIQFGSAHALHVLRVVDGTAEPPVLLLDASGLSGPMLRLGVATGETTSNRRILDIASQEPPRVLSSKPSVLAGLAEAAEANRLVLQIPLILSGGAALSLELKTRLERVFGGAVRSVYGLSETGPLAYECIAGGYHVDTSAYHVEIDEGEIVVSTLLNTALPLIRYRTGDCGRFAQHRCACGRAGPVIEALMGRIVPRFRFGNKLPISPTEIFRDMPLAVAGLVDFCVTQETPNLLRITLVTEPRSDGRAFAQIASDVRRYCRDRIPGNIILRIEQCCLDTTDKFQRYRSLVS